MHHSPHLPHRLVVALALLFTALPAWAHAAEHGSHDRPNIVVIYADDLGFGDLSCYGATKVNTPNIDQLAKDGKRFTDAHVASPVCTPSRVSLLTGEYSHRLAPSGPIFLKQPLCISPDKETMADMLKRAGYSTACIGKWHLGFGEKNPVDWNKPLSPGPNDLGFDYYYGMPVVNSHAPFVWVENTSVVGYDPKDPFVYGKTANTKRFREKMQIDAIGGAEEAHALYDDEEVGTHLKDKAIEWIKTESADKTKPFFLYFPTTNIHHPFTPAPQFKGTSHAGMYGDFIHELDWMVGEVIKSLEEAGVADNTLIIFTSDNGGMLNMGGQEAIAQGHRLNGDLQGFKFDAWEGGHRVPFIVKWPGKVKAGATSDQLIMNNDLYATFASITGQKVSEGQARDSLNVLSAFITEDTKPVRTEAVITPKDRKNRLLRVDEWVYISAQGGGGFNSQQVGSHGFGGAAGMHYAGNKNSDYEDGKIRPDAPDAQLYNLKSDPKQEKNVVLTHPEKAAEMKARLAEILTMQRTAPREQ